MQDVAKQVGVSHQTVSRVLNGSDSVSDETRARVLQAIEELGYRRNSAARALVTRRSQVLGVVGFDTTLYGPTSTLFAIEQAAREAGYFVSVASVKATTAGNVRAAVDRLTEQNADGVVVIAPLRTGEPLSGLPIGLPAVVVTRAPRPGWRRSGSTRRRAAGWPPGTCWTRERARSGTSPGRPTGSTRRTGWPGGGRSCRAAARQCTGRCAARGARPPATKPAGS